MGSSLAILAGYGSPQVTKRTVFDTLHRAICHKITFRKSPASKGKCVEGDNRSVDIVSTSELLQLPRPTIPAIKAGMASETGPEAETELKKYYEKAITTR